MKIERERWNEFEPEPCCCCSSCILLVAIVAAAAAVVVIISFSFACCAFYFNIARSFNEIWDAHFRYRFNSNSIKHELIVKHQPSSCYALSSRLHYQNPFRNWKERDLTLLRQKRNEKKNTQLTTNCEEFDGFADLYEHFMEFHDDFECPTTKWIYL